MLAISKRLVALAALSALILPTSAALADFDVRPYLDASGVIVTGGHDDDANVNVTQRSAFGFDLDEDGYTTHDPGFNTAGNALSAFANLNFRVESNLGYWDGTGAVDFDDAPAGTALDLADASSDVTVTAASGQQPGFTIGTADGSGHLHRHLQTTLSATGVPATGIYIVEVTLVQGTDASTRSAPFYLLFNNGADEDAFDDAVAAFNGD